MDAADERRGELDDRAQEINESIAVSNENPPTSDALEWNGVFDLNPRSLQYLKDHYKDNPPEFLSVPTPGYGLHGIRRAQHNPMESIGVKKRQNPTQRIWDLNGEDNDHAATTGELVVASVDTIPFEEVATFNAWFDELRKGFGRRTPEFAQEKGHWVVGESVEVIEATIGGSTEQGFDSNALAFAIDETGSKAKISTDGSLGTHENCRYCWKLIKTGNRPEPFQKHTLKKRKPGDTAKQSHKDFMNRVANKPQPSNIQKVQNAQKQRRCSMRDRQIIDLTSSTASPSPPLREETDRVFLQYLQPPDAASGVSENRLFSLISGDAATGRPTPSHKRAEQKDSTDDLDDLDEE
ncbi:MAG: hypothetical protein Q9194_001505 [Teloschistes cf. exilis]